MTLHTFSNESPHAGSSTPLTGKEKILAEFLQEIIEAYCPGGPRTLSDQANFQHTVVRASKAWTSVFGFGDAISPTDESYAKHLVTIGKKLWPNPRSRAEILREVATILNTGFPMDNPRADSGIITQGPILANSICPHHLLPVSYEIFVSYKPLSKSGSRVLGLSKLARLAVALTNRPVLQEQATLDIADALHYTEPAEYGVAVESDGQYRQRFSAAQCKDLETQTDIPQMWSDGSAVQLIGLHSCMSCRGARSSAHTLTTVLRGAFREHDSLKAEFYQGIESIRRSQVPKTFISTSKL